LSLDTILWLCGLLAEAGVVVLCIRGRLFKQMPVFCSYLVWSLFVDPLLYFLSKSFSQIYFRAYVYQLIADAAFQFAVIVELGWAVLRPIRPSLPKHSILILIFLVVCTAAIIWPITAAMLPDHLTPSGRFLVHVQQTVAAMRITAFLALAGLSQLLSIGWRNRELQVATGLGFFSMFSLAVSLIHSHQKVGAYYEQLDRLVVASYLCSLVYWIVSFVQEEEERQEFTPQMRSFLLTVTGAARTGRVALANSGIGPSRKPGEP
jgi:hypothetical protein